MLYIFWCTTRTFFFWEGGGAKRCTSSSFSSDPHDHALQDTLIVQRCLCLSICPIVFLVGSFCSRFGRCSRNHFPFAGAQNGSKRLLLSSKIKRETLAGDN